jgi:hypothetical protein
MVEVRNNHAVPMLAQDMKQAQTIWSAGDPGDNRAVLCQTTLIMEDGCNIFEHLLI